MWKWFSRISRSKKRRPCSRFVRPSFDLLEQRIVPFGPPTDTIQAFVYVDSNNNGQPDLNEARVPGVDITLNVNGSDALTRTTDSNGRSWFGPGWGNGAVIQINMHPTKDSGDGTPFHYFSGLATDYITSKGPNNFTFTNPQILRQNFIPQDFGSADFNRDTYLDGAEGFYFGIKPNDQLVVTAQPTTSVLNGSQFDVQIQVNDASGNQDNRFNGNVTLQLANDPAGSTTLGGTLTLPVQNGMADFPDLTLNHAGQGFTLQATSDGAKSATTDPFDIKDKLVVTTQPPSTVDVDKTFDVQISAEDVNNKVDDSFTGNVDLAFGNDPNGNSTLGGTHPVAAKSGVADFSDLTVDKGGKGFTLQATSNGQDSATTDSFDVGKFQLVITEQPTEANWSGNQVACSDQFDVQVSVEDGNGNVDDKFTGDVTIAIDGAGTNPGGGTLGGTLHVAVQNGVADFSDLTINEAGQGYTLKASADGPDSGTTDPFTVVDDIVVQSVKTEDSRGVKVTYDINTDRLSQSFDIGIFRQDTDQFDNSTIQVQIGTLTVGTLAQGHYADQPVDLSVMGGGLNLTDPLGIAPKVPFVLAEADPDGKLPDDITADSSAAHFHIRILGAVTQGFGPSEADWVQPMVNSLKEQGYDWAFPIYWNSFRPVSGQTTLGAQDMFNELVQLVNILPGAEPNDVYDVHLIGHSRGSAVVDQAMQSLVNAAASGSLPQQLACGYYKLTFLDPHPANASTGDLLSLATPPPTPAAIAAYVLVLEGYYLASNRYDDPMLTVPARVNQAEEYYQQNPTYALSDAVLADSGNGFEKYFNLQGLSPDRITFDDPTQTLVNSYNWTPLGLGHSEIWLWYQRYIIPTLGSGSPSPLVTGNPGGPPSPSPPASQLIDIPSPDSMQDSSGNVDPAAGAPFTLYVVAVNSQGAPDPNYNGPITLSLKDNPNGATLSGTLTVNAVHGVAKFSNLILSKSGSGYTFVAVAKGLSGGVSPAFAFEPDQLELTTPPPDSNAAGSAFGLVATVKDGLGNTDTSFIGDVTVALNNYPGEAATLGGTVTMPAIMGVANFSDLTIDKTGNYTLSLTASGAAGITSGSIAVTAGTATKLVAAVQPVGNVTVGSNFQLVVKAEDNNGNVDPNFSATVGLAFQNNPGGANLGGTLQMAAMHGVANFGPLTIDKAASGYAIHAASSSLNTTTDPIDVTIAGVATRLVIDSQPPSQITAGTQFGLIAKAEDGFGTVDASFTGDVTVALINAPGESGTLGGTALMHVTAGVATFSGLTVNQAGSYNLAASAAGFASKTTNNFTVAAASADHLVLQGPSQASAGGAFGVKVRAVDPFGNTDTTFSGFVDLVLGSNGPPGGKLTGANLGLATSGVASLNKLAFTVPGSYSIFAEGNGSLPSQTLAVAVTTTTKFAVTGTPVTTTAGQLFAITVTAQDANGNPDTSYQGTIHLFSTDPQTALPADYPFKAADHGQAMFNIMLTTAGKQTISAMDATNAAAKGTSAKVLVNPASLKKLQVSGYPTADTQGVTHSVLVQALDSFGNLIPSYKGTVHLASNPAGASGLPVKDYTFLPATDKGQHAFVGISFGSLGTFSLTAADQGNNLSASEDNIQVLAKTKSLSIGGIAGSPTSGLPFSFTVTALLAGGTDTNFLDTIRITSSDSAFVPFTYTFVPGDNGSKQITITPHTAGAQSLKIIDMSRSTVTAASIKGTVLPGAIAHLFLTGIPNPDVSGVAHTVTVTAKDAAGNVATNATDTIQLSSSDADIQGLPASFMFASGDHGVHTITGVKLLTPGSQTITAKLGAVSGGQSVKVTSAATSLQVMTSVPSVAAGTPFSITVTSKKGLATDTHFADQIKIASSDPSFVPFNYTFVPGASGDNGSKSFQITLLKADATLTITDLTRPAPAVPAAHATITIKPGSLAGLQLSGVPASAVAGDTYALSVIAADANGNPVPSYTGTVTFGSSGVNVTGLPASYKFLATDKGKHTFTGVKLGSALGTWALGVDDGSHSHSASIPVVNLSAGISAPGPVGARGQPLPFQLTAMGGGGGPFTWTVTWGDGSPVTHVTGNSGQTVSHTYKASGSGMISVTVADSLGNVSPAATTLAGTIAALALETDPANNTKTALVIGGTTGMDTIVISPADSTGDMVSVTINGAIQKIGSQSTFSPSGHILVYGQGGGDTIQISNTFGLLTVPVTIRAVVFGGGGNSTLSAAGSSADNILVGGAGKDNLTGGAGRDILIGGTGADKIHASNGGAILIAGGTVYDTNLAALLALAAEWSSADSYQTRVQDLFGTGSGGQNGSTLLDAAAILPDHMINQLFGGSSLDWFWLSAGDQLSGPANGEAASLR